MHLRSWLHRPARRTSLNAPDLKGELPCKNGGKCFNAVNNFTCDCQNTGYTGGNCTEDIDEFENLQTDCGHGRCRNLSGYECVCDFGYCGYNCAMLDPCQENYRQNSGTCRCAKGGGYECEYTSECTSEYTGLNCTEWEHLFSSKAIDIAVIVGPIVGCFFLIIISCLTALFMMARKKRATRGTYSPSAQEFSNSRVEMDNVMKPLTEERLI